MWSSLSFDSLSIELHSPEIETEAEMGCRNLQHVKEEDQSMQDNIEESEV